MKQPTKGASAERLRRDKRAQPAGASLPAKPEIEQGQTCVLAYSGGLDTSVAVAWLRETYGFEVVTCTGDLGSVDDLEAVQRKALRSGARKAIVHDARDTFVRFFVWPALQADALYQGRYPLATALGRPLLAKLLVDAAREEGARYVAHGCTGKGNDQVRFDLAVGALAPELTVIAPMRGGMNMTRDEEIDYAKARGIPVPATKASPYSVDENLWGRSIEAGVLEDPWGAPPRDVYAWTADPDEAPAQGQEIVIAFREGIPFALDGRELDGVTLVEQLNGLAGSHGVGRIDQIEDRLVGIKSREIYEAPAAVVLLLAHRALEDMVLSRESLRFKSRVADDYADLVYNGLWFSAHHQDLAAYIRSTQRFVSGEVRVRLQRGTASVVGRRSEHSLYSVSLATYGKGDTFDQKAAEGFIGVYGLPLRNQSRTQALWGPESEATLQIPKRVATSTDPDDAATADGPASAARPSGPKPGRKARGRHR
ncbi:MAG TPA: argininosuccinate synthase [Candidatus Limnocylindria bacterium]